MPRGGKRENAGRNSSWASGCGRNDTTSVRVPKYLKNEIVKLAHDLDEAKVSNVRKAFVENLDKNKLVVQPPIVKKKDLHELKDDALCFLQVGKSSNTYKKTRKSFNYFINQLYVKGYVRGEKQND